MPLIRFPEAQWTEPYGPLPDPERWKTVMVNPKMVTAVYPSMVLGLTEICLVGADVPLHVNLPMADVLPMLEERDR